MSVNFIFVSIIRWRVHDECYVGENLGLSFPRKNSTEGVSEPKDEGNI